MLDPNSYPLSRLADQVGTPFYLYDAQVLRDSCARLSKLVQGQNLVCRYAMKANSARQVLQTVRESGLWIDAVSGNEVLRALAAGFPAGAEPPVVMLTTDVFRDNALTSVLEHRVLPNLGSPGMVNELRDAGYKGPIGLRVNPGFGHGHVKSCDTGGPSSKHGIWPDQLAAVRRNAAEARLPVVTLHAHVGTGPELREFDANMKRLVSFMASLLPEFPDVASVNLGGGLPHPYRPGKPAYDLAWYRPVLEQALAELQQAAGRPIRVEIEPGRYPVAGMGLLVTRVKDIKDTQTNDKGPGNKFVMVDAGFADLARPAMYGSYHHMTVVGKGAGRPETPVVVAGPLCESGDVFTRDDRELLDPRALPLPDEGDLLVLHDAGAYGMAMSSNYVSQSRVPQVWWDGGQAKLISRRESFEDVVRNECDEALAL